MPATGRITPNLWYDQEAEEAAYYYAAAFAGTKVGPVKFDPAELERAFRDEAARS